jgi:hypothetical protein
MGNRLQLGALCALALCVSAVSTPALAEQSAQGNTVRILTEQRRPGGGSKPALYFPLTGAQLAFFTPTETPTASTMLAAASRPGAGGAAAARRKQGGVLPGGFTIGLRLGAVVSPDANFAGGVDVRVPGFRLLQGAYTRLDLDYLALKGRDLVPITFDQIYELGIPLAKVYLGLGIGPYFGDGTEFGGKILVGANLARLIGLEAAVHFVTDVRDPLVTIQARFAL